MTNRPPLPPPASAPAASFHIPVLCEACFALGSAGRGDFAQLGDLLDFDPVPRRPRTDGWNAEVQRSFIVALAATGSTRQAAAAVGKAPHGAMQLRNAPGNEGFLAAWAKALEHHKVLKAHRLAEGVRSAAAWSQPRAPWANAATRRGLPLLAPPAPAPGAGEEADEDEVRAEKMEWLRDILWKYWLKVEQERTCRLAGRVVEADFYVRQLTWIEVVIDLMSGDGARAMADFRAEGHHLIEIAETPFSRILGEARRRKWARLEEPGRPEHPPREHLSPYGRFSTQPREACWGGSDAEIKAQERELEERHRKAAAEQISWEAEARRDYERRREATPLKGEEPGSAGQPAPSQQGRQD